MVHFTPELLVHFTPELLVHFTPECTKYGQEIKITVA